MWLHSDSPSRHNSIYTLCVKERSIPPLECKVKTSRSLQCNYNGIQRRSKLDLVSVSRRLGVATTASRSDEKEFSILAKKAKSILIQILLTREREIILSEKNRENYNSVFSLLGLWQHAGLKITIKTCKQSVGTECFFSSTSTLKQSLYVGAYLGWYSRAAFVASADESNLILMIIWCVFAARMRFSVVESLKMMVCGHSKTHFLKIVQPNRWFISAEHWKKSFRRINWKQSRWSQYRFVCMYYKDNLHRVNIKAFLKVGFNYPAELSKRSTNTVSFVRLQIPPSRRK